MAITYVQKASINPGSSGIVTLLNPVAVGDLIVVYTFVSFTASAVTPAATDSLGNSYSLVSGTNSYQGGSSRQIFVLWTRVTNPGATCAITVTPAVGVNCFIDGVHFNGFAGIATAVDGTFLYQGASTTALTSTSFNTSQANEMVLAFDQHLGAGAAFSTPPSGWTNQSPNTFSNFYYQLFSSQATATNYSGTLAVSDTFFNALAGFYDGAPPLQVSSISIFSLGPG